jgi:hypothetical protein
MKQKKITKTERRDLYFVADEMNEEILVGVG